MKMLSRAFALKASEQLAQGQVDSAFDNLEHVFQLADKLKSEPILISQLVRESHVPNRLPASVEGMTASVVGRATGQNQKQMDELDFLKDMFLELKVDRDVFLDSCSRIFVKRQPRPLQHYRIFQ